MLITTDSGHREDAGIYGVGRQDIFLPLSTYSGVLNLDVDSTEWRKPLIYSKDMSTIIELNVDSDLASVNGKEVILPHEVYEYNGLVMIPIKFISSQFGYTVKDTYCNIHFVKTERCLHD